MLGGNAAERLVFGDTTTGASNDIEKATDLARRMVTEFGMSDRMGPRAYGKREEMIFLGREIGEQRNYSDDVARQIDEEVRSIIETAYARAQDVLTATGTSSTSSPRRSSRRRRSTAWSSRRSSRTCRRRSRSTASSRSWPKGRPPEPTAQPA